MADIKKMQDRLTLMSRRRGVKHQDNCHRDFISVYPSRDTIHTHYIHVYEYIFLIETTVVGTFRGPPVRGLLIISFCILN